MIVIGIDPSLTQTAVVIGTSPTDFKVTFHKSKPLGDTVRHRVQRYDNLVASVMRVIEKATINSPFVGINQDEFLPCRIFLENYAFGCKWDQHALAELGGLIRWHLVDRDPDLCEVAPASLKRFVTGKGTAKKEMMLMHVQKQWGYESQNSDDCDAFGLYRLGLCVCGLDEPKNQAQRDVVGKLRF